MYKIDVCIACDNNYSKYAGVLVASILHNADLEDYLNFYILDGGIKKDNKEKIEQLKTIKNCSISFIKINEKDFEDYKAIKTHSYITLPAYYRLKLASLLPNLDRIIYFDCDFVVNSSLRNLFQIDMRDNILAGVKDINRRMLRKNQTYVNSGMLLFNLKNMREQNTEKLLLDYTKTHIDHIKTGDQQIINEALLGKIQIIKDKWNVQSSNFTNRSSYIKHPNAIHFVAKRKPWHFASFSYHKDLYFKYLQLTPWKLTQKEYFKWTTINNIVSYFTYFLYRPLFFLRPRFYEALFKTYILPYLSYKKPIIKKNTFIVWEPCSKSHSEVVPGYVKYLLDLGYHVSVLVHPNRIKEGLFDRFNNKNLSINKMSRKQIKKYFQKSDLSNVSGVLVTTVGKLCDEIHFNDAYNTFSPDIDKSKILFVSHEAKHAIDNDTWTDKLITLRELNYKNAKSTVVNPHYFGDVKITPKNDKITNFVMIGAIKPYKKDDNIIIEAIDELVNNNVTNFKITVIGKGHIKNIPRRLRKYFDIKGRLPFKKMYRELEKADFILSAYDENNIQHIRYNTTGTSGNFQLVYGFLKPCIIINSFSKINGFNDENSILYKTNKDYSNAMDKAIKMSQEDYLTMQKNLKQYTDKLYNSSLENIRGLIKHNEK